MDCFCLDQNIVDQVVDEMNNQYLDDDALEGHIAEKLCMNIPTNKEEEDEMLETLNLLNNKGFSIASLILMRPYYEPSFAARCISHCSLNFLRKLNKMCEDFEGQNLVELMMNKAEIQEGDNPLCSVIGAFGLYKWNYLVELGAIADESVMEAALQAGNYKAVENLIQSEVPITEEAIAAGFQYASTPESYKTLELAIVNSDFNQSRKDELLKRLKKELFSNILESKDFYRSEFRQPRCFIKDSGTNRWIPE